MKAIMRCKKLSSMGSVAGSLQHCFRERETPNAVSELTPKNQHAEAKSTDEAMGRLRNRLPAKRRKDAVLAIEYVMTASPEFWTKASKSQQLEFFNLSYGWLADKFGKDNILVASIHYDETSPHLSAFVVPRTKDGRLSAKEFIGDRSKMTADQTSFAKAVKHLGLERGIEGSKATHTTISEYYRRVATSAPKVPSVAVPEPSIGDRIKPAEYGERVAQSVIEQFTPTLTVMQAKAQELEAVKKRISELERVAREAQSQAKAEQERANSLAEIEQLFTPAEIAEARARKALRDKEEAERKAARDQAEAERKSLAEKERRQCERIEALPALAHKTVGAARTFVIHALEAIKVAGGDASKVEWSLVEGNAAVEAIRDNGQSPQSVIRAINELSPIRGTADSDAKVAEWVLSVAPRYQQEYEKNRGRSNGLEH